MAKRKAYRPARTRRKNTKPARVLLHLFFGGVAIRFLLAVLLKINPTVTPDEALYVNIAKSLVERGEILFRGQPSNYAYLLYPMLLSPVYALLPPGVDFLIIIQLLNSCLICSIVFPVYYAAKEITGDNERSLLVAVIALFTPDMAMSSFIMSESLIYALYFACFYQLVLAVKRARLINYALVGVFGALMYYTKNFHVILAVVFLALMLIVNLARKKYKEALFALAGGALLAGLCAGLMAISKYAFGLVAPTYTINTAGDVLGGIGNMLSNLAPYAEGFVMYAAFFTLALCGVFFVIPAFKLRAFSRDNRLIALTVGGALAIVLVAVVYVIHPGTRRDAFSARIELRYLSMYFLPLIALAFAKEADDKRLGVLGASWLALTSVYMFIAGLGSGFAKATANVDNHSLAIFAPLFIGDVPSRVMSVLMGALLLALAVYVFTRGWTRAVKRVSVICLIAVFSASNIAAYSINTVRNFAHLRLDSLEIARGIADAGGDALLVTWQLNSTESIAADTRTKTILEATEYDVFIRQIARTGGVYVPYVPESSRHVYPDRPLIDASVIVFDGGCDYYFQFAPGVTIKRTHSGVYTLIENPKGARAFTSVFAGIGSDDIIPPREAHALIRVFDAATLDASGQLTIAMSVTAPRGGSVFFDAGEGVVSHTLTRGDNAFTVRVNAPNQFPLPVHVYTNERNIKLQNFEVLYE